MSFFRGLFIVVVMLGVAIVSTGAFAAVPLTMTHQGRMLDATDHPVNGFFDITYRIYDVPTGGVPLWGEVHPSVQVTDGLFSAVLGSTFPLSADVLGSGGGGGGGGSSARYLEVAVGATTLSPRSPLSSAPSAISAAHLSGDVETLPNLLVIGDPLTDNHATFGEKVNQGLQAAGSALSQGATRITNECDGSTASQVMEKKGLNAVNVKLARTISSPPGGPLAQDYLDVDSDDDGVMDRSISSSLDATGARLKVNNIGSSGQDGVSISALPTSSSVAINTKGTGADKSRIASTTNPETATTLHEADLDGDGVMDVTSTDSVGAAGASRKLVANNIGSSGQDGVSVDLRCSPDSAAESTELRKNGAVVCADYSRHTPFHNKRISSFFDVFTEVSMEDVCDSAGASRKLESHNIGSSGQDGVEVKWAARPSGASFKAITTKGTGANGMTRSIEGSADSVAATVLLEADLDGDGIPDNTIKQTCDATGSKQLLAGTTSVAGTSRSASLEVAASPGGGASFKGQITQNSQSLRCSSGADSAAATTLLEADLDGDGVMDVTSADSVGATGASRRLKSSGIGSSGNDGVEVSLSAIPSGASFRAINTKGVPGRKSRCIGSADSAAATMLLDADDDADGHSEISAAVSSVGSLSGGPGGGAAAAAYARMSADSDDDGVADVTAEMVADADSACFRLNGLPPGVPVTGTISMTASPTGAHMAVGAATCDGTNWVNASDRNSKENFTAVDGNELLEQIAQLSITRWNYKGNNQAEHIGPTAQDFKAAFGVGADDKSISTIDPSGIALAAIKALNSKMQELNAKTSQLEDQAREITQLKAELDAIKAMLQKQSTTKN
jgi:hypothetical protein